MDGWMYRWMDRRTIHLKNIRMKGGKRKRKTRNESGRTEWMDE